MFRVVLVEPEIPPNTGSIGRLCLATRCELHLVHPLGFDISDASLRRAGLDYWEHLTVQTHASLDAFLASLPADASLALYSKSGKKSYLDLKYREGTYLIFGKETKGLPQHFTSQYADRCYAIPILDSRVRSLNLANAASIVVYEGLRQMMPEG